MSAGTFRFLSVENVLLIHDDTLSEEGGLHAIRDLGLLESAVAMPQAMYGGEYLHHGLAEMAAAYLYHICQNHAFVDGNKRTAAFACVLFLSHNGIPDERLPDEAALEKVTLNIASGKTAKSEAAEWLQQYAPDQP